MADRTLNFLVFGDVVGRLGRQALTVALPGLIKKTAADSVIVNIENMAHGQGISPQTWAEALKWDASVYTTGDHAWDNQAGLSLLNDPTLPIIRPANYPPGLPGRGYHCFTIGATRIAVINLQGQVFFRNHPANPFHFLDDLLQRPDIKNCSVKLLDFHAEATSETKGLAWYADGRLSAVWGTHTHVPTADAQILPRGTGYLTDVGMNGAYHSIIGMKPAGPLKTFRQQLKHKFEPPESGPLEINALELQINVNTGKTIHIAHHRQIVNDEANTAV
jgi:metallophosphoesterase (TIGR00282 family)